MTLPEDPNILLSYVNMKLRDDNLSFEDFCAENDVDIDELKKRLASFGYFYDDVTSSFKKK
ncbi:MAG: DUF4250 domain-containing protein [Clostridia bacterium]|nr:DUF4250 domain-containing protein [Clostridia bacterium]